MLSHTQARKIASEWHGGQSSALYALASSGAITGDKEICTIEDTPHLYAVGEILLDMELADKEGRKQLAELLEYIEFYGERDAQENWASLNF